MKDHLYAVSIELGGQNIIISQICLISPIKKNIFSNKYKMKVLMKNGKTTFVSNKDKQKIEFERSVLVSVLKNYIESEMKILCNIYKKYIDETI